MFKVPEQYRVKEGKYKTSEKDGNKGVFLIPCKKGLFKLSYWIQVVAPELPGWEQLAVCVINMNKTKILERYPTIDELKKVKKLFWSDVDVCAIFLRDGKESKLDYVVTLSKRIGSIYESPKQ